VSCQNLVLATTGKGRLTRPLIRSAVSRERDLDLLDVEMGLRDPAFGTLLGFPGARPRRNAAWFVMGSEGTTVNGRVAVEARCGRVPDVISV